MSVNPDHDTFNVVAVLLTKLTIALVADGTVVSTDVVDTIKMSLDADVVVDPVKATTAKLYVVPAVNPVIKLDVTTPTVLK